MSTELAVTSVRDLEVIAQRVAKSRLFGMDPDQIFALALVAEARGLKPIDAVQRYHVIQGRPAMRADAMQAEFQRHGGSVEWLASDAEECKAVFRHPKHAPKGFEVHVTFAELDRVGVTRAGRDLKDNWKKFPRQMLRARCISEGVRAVDPGIIVGIYTPEEISDFDARDTPIETTARVVQPEFDQAKAIENVKRHIAERDAPRVQDRHEPVEAVVAELDATPAEFPNVVERPKPTTDPRPYQQFLFDARRNINEWWGKAAEEEGFAYAEVVNVHQIENHMASLALKDKGLKEGYFDNANGTRDRKKVVAFLAKWHAKYPEEFEDLVRGYCEDKLKGACAEKGLVYDVTDEPEGEDSLVDPETGEAVVIERETADEDVSEAERKWSES